MRIVSLSPGATEVVCALGMRGSLVGASHECFESSDLAGLELKVLTRTRLPLGAPAPTIDGAVKTARAAGQELHVLDAAALRALAPDLILAPAEADGRTPCALSAAEAERAASSLDTRVLTHGPARLSDMLGSIRAIGEALDRGAAAARLVAELRSRMEAVRGRVALAEDRPRVVLLAWAAPPIAAGGMLAELVRLAGGEPVAADVPTRVRALQWEQVIALQPQVIVLAPCGMTLDQARGETEALRKAPGLADTEAARWGQVHVVGGRGTLSTSGPGIVRGLEILARLVHPELAWPEDADLRALSRPVALGV